MTDDCGHHRYAQQAHGIAACADCDHTWVIDPEVNAAWLAAGSPENDGVPIAPPAALEPAPEPPTPPVTGPEPDPNAPPPEPNPPPPDPTK